MKKNRQNLSGVLVGFVKIPVMIMDILTKHVSLIILSIQNNDN